MIIAPSPAPWAQAERPREAHGSHARVSSLWGGPLHGNDAYNARQGLALGGCCPDTPSLGYVWWTEGFWQMEKSGIFSFSNGLEVFLVLAPGILLLILGRRLRARHEKFISSFAESAQKALDRSGTQANQ